MTMTARLHPSEKAMRKLVRAMKRRKKTVDELRTTWEQVGWSQMAHICEGMSAEIDIWLLEIENMRET